MINGEKWQSRIFDKNSGSFSKFQKCAIFRGFSTFEGKLVIDLVLFLVENVSTHCRLAAREDRTSGKNPVLEIIIQKVHIWVKSGVQRSSYISRTVNAIENLIWYSESTKNYLSECCPPIFSYLSSSGWKFDLKTANFQFLVHFLNVLQTFSRQLL